MYLAAVLGHRPSVDHRKLLLLYLSASLFKLETTGGGSFSKFREKLKPVVTREPQGLELDSGNHVLAVCHTMPRARRRTSGNLWQVSFALAVACLTRDVHAQIVNGVCVDMGTFAVTGPNAGDCQRNETANSEVLNSPSGLCDATNPDGRCLTQQDVDVLWDHYLPSFAQGA
jgi:hypothetical protein